MKRKMTTILLAVALISLIGCGKIGVLQQLNRIDASKSTDSQENEEQENESSTLVKLGTEKNSQEEEVTSELQEREVTEQWEDTYRQLMVDFLYGVRVGATVYPGTCNDSSRFMLKDTDNDEVPELLIKPDSNFSYCGFWYAYDPDALTLDDYNVWFTGIVPETGELVGYMEEQNPAAVTGIVSKDEKIMLYNENYDIQGEEPYYIVCIETKDGEVVCRDATPEEVHDILEKDDMYFGNLREGLPVTKENIEQELGSASISPEIDPSLLIASWSEPGSNRAFMDITEDGRVNGYCYQDCPYYLDGNTLSIYGEEVERCPINSLTESWLQIGNCYSYRSDSKEWYIAPELVNGFNDNWVLKDATLSDVVYGGIHFSTIDDYNSIECFYGTPDNGPGRWDMAATEFPGAVIARDGIIHVFVAPNEECITWPYHVEGDSLF